MARRNLLSRTLGVAVLGGLFVAIGCSGEDGAIGPRGPAGPPGESAGGQGEPGPQGDKGDKGDKGEPGPKGDKGDKGDDGEEGEQGEPGSSAGAGPRGEPGEPGAPGAPGPSNLITTTIAEHVQAALEDDEEIALENASTDTVRTLRGLHANVVVKWLDPLTYNDGVNAPRFGANTDFIAYFGDGWDADGTPIYGGASNAGYMWANFEYVSGNAPNLSAAPDAQQLGLAKWLVDRGQLGIDPAVAAQWDQPSVNLFVNWHKRQIGGGWFRVLQDPASGEWSIDRSDAANKRFDATSSTQLLVEGIALSQVGHDDAGAALPANVVPGLQGDCSGGQTPWGTVITAEENVQDFYGDLEQWWSSSQAFVPGRGADPGAAISFTYTPTTSGAFGRSTDPNALQPRDFYGYLSEIDPSALPNEYYGKTTAGVGHRKLGAMGRARWENASIVTGTNHQLVNGQPIVVYGANDRRSGRVYKFVSQNNWTTGMTKAQTRALLSSGRLYVAHFADLFNAGSGYTIGTTTGNQALPTAAAPGDGVWIHLSTTNVTQDAPNAPTLGAGTKVGAALLSNTWNGIGGFADQDSVLRALFTAENKIGVRELNRPEDVEWNPFDKRLYIAFTNNGSKVSVDQNGVLYDPATHSTTSPTRDDPYGALFVLDEANANNPGASLAFTFHSVWQGTGGKGVYDAANPDNILIDPVGNVFFGTDGNFGRNGTADAIYYLDREEGRAVRIVAVPSDAETTGPSLTPDGKTLFLSVQHPGESVYSAWPNDSKYGPLSSIVAVTVAP